MVRQYPELRGTLTDLLIGDLFHDRVDKVWGPLESLYEPGKPPIPRWDAGTPAAVGRRTRPTSWCCPRGADRSEITFTPRHRGTET